MMRFFDPYLYTHLIERRKVVGGRDILPDIQPPDNHVFAQKVLSQIPTLLMFTRSQKLILPYGASRFSDHQFESIIRRGLFIKLYLEKGMVRRKYKELVEESRHNYPEVYERLGDLRNRNSVEETQISLESFRLLSRITTEIHGSLKMSTAGVPRNDYVNNVVRASRPPGR